MERESHPLNAAFYDDTPHLSQNPHQNGSVHPFYHQHSEISTSRHDPPPTTQSIKVSARKVQSLPGHYNRSNGSNIPQTSFREAFANSRSPTPTRRNDILSPASPPAVRNLRALQSPPTVSQTVQLSFDQPLRGCESYGDPFGPTIRRPKAQRPQEPLPLSAHSNGTPSNEAKNGASDDKKNKRSILGFFKKPKQKKSEVFSSNSDGEQQNGQQNGRTAKTNGRAKEFSTPQTHRKRNAIANSSNIGQTVVSPNHAILDSGNFPAGQPLGIPLLSPPNGKLLKNNVSASHGSIPAANFQRHHQNSGGGSLHNSSFDSSLSKRCISTENVSRREKRLALKNKVESLRSKYGESSSDDDHKSLSSQSTYDSGNSLNRMGSTKRSRAARTERYLRRKSHELETLKQETQKDKKSREAVKARILEIQRLQQYEAEREKSNQKAAEPLDNNKPKWTANLVYQESTSEIDPVVLATPPSSRHGNRYTRALGRKYEQQIQASNTSLDSSGVQLINKPLHSDGKTSFGVSVERNSLLTRRGIHNALSGNLKNNRSVSYDCNINKTVGLPSPPIDNKVQVTPPPPPPRDKSRILSPADPPRPFSYSFESIYQGPQEKNSLVNGKKNMTASQGIRAVLSQTRLNGTQTLTNRATPELSQEKPSFLRPPNIPPLPSSNSSVDSPETSLQSLPSHFSQTPSTHNIPPSPPDYSYASDSNARLNQMNDVWKQKEQHLKKVITNAGANPNETLISDSSRSSTPRTDRSGNNIQNNSLTLKDRLKPNLKADSLSSLSCPSEVPSPVSRNHGPEPPKRSGSRGSNLSSLEKAKLEMQMILEQEKTLQQTKAQKIKQFEEAYLREKRKLERARCANFEDALHELEQIYKSLKLDEDGMTEESNKNGLNTTMDENDGMNISDKVLSKKSLNSSSADKAKDDMHSRRYQKGTNNSQDAYKIMQMTGSFLAIPQVQLATSDTEIRQLKEQSKSSKEPDILLDDASLRNIKRANSIKVIDPQPPFGIPLGPTTQASPNDYLHVDPVEVQAKVQSLPRKEPDPALDDLAFRNLRRDQRENPANDIKNFNGPFRHTRSQSVDRSRIAQQFENCVYDHVKGGGKTSTPRQVKLLNDVKKTGKFSDSYRDALNAGDSTPSLRSNRYNPSWLEQANLDDPSLVGGLSSSRAHSQPDIRNAIIKEAKDPTGGPEEWKDGNPFRTPENNFMNASTEDLAAPRLVKIQAMNNSIPSSEQGFISKKLYKPLDKIYNAKPKPFYKSDSVSSLNTSTLNSPTNTVNIGQLESLISSLTLSAEESSPTRPTYTRVYPPSGVKTSPKPPESPSKPKTAKDNSSSPNKPSLTEEADNSKLPHEKLSVGQEPQTEDLSTYQKYEVKSAKKSIMNAIRLSMAMDTPSSEGKDIVSRSKDCTSAEHDRQESLPHDQQTKADSTLSSPSCSLPSANALQLNACVTSLGALSSRSPKYRTLTNPTEITNTQYILPMDSPHLKQSAVKAVTCTDKIRSLVAQSESVARRGTRAHSLPVIQPLPFARQNSKENDSKLQEVETQISHRHQTSRSISHNEEMIRCLMKIDTIEKKSSVREETNNKINISKSNGNGSIDPHVPSNRRKSFPWAGASLEACVKELSTGIGILRSTVGPSERLQGDCNKGHHLEVLPNENQKPDSPAPSTVRLDDDEFDEILNDYQKEVDGASATGDVEDLFTDAHELECLNSDEEAGEGKVVSEYESLENAQEENFWEALGEDETKTGKILGSEDEKHPNESNEQLKDANSTDYTNSNDRIVEGDDAEKNLPSPNTDLLIEEDESDSEICQATEESSTAAEDDQVDEDVNGVLSDCEEQDMEESSQEKYEKEDPFENNRIPSDLEVKSDSSSAGPAGEEEEDSSDGKDDVRSGEVVCCAPPQVEWIHSILGGCYVLASISMLVGGVNLLDAFALILAMASVLIALNSTN